jgi:hypothetical protein
MSDETKPNLDQLEGRADDGDPQAMNMLGEMYAEGLDVDQDDDAAVEWFRKAAEAGYPPAIKNLINMLADGRGVAESVSECVEWVQKACIEGDHCPVCGANEDQCGKHFVMLGGFLGHPDSDNAPSSYYWSPPSLRTELDKIDSVFDRFEVDIDEDEYRDFLGLLPQALYEPQPNRKFVWKSNRAYTEWVFSGAPTYIGEVGVSSGGPPGGAWREFYALDVIACTNHCDDVLEDHRSKLQEAYDHLIKLFYRKHFLQSLHRVYTPKGEIEIHLDEENPAFDRFVRKHRKKTWAVIPDIEKSSFDLLPRFSDLRSKLESVGCLIFEGISEHRYPVVVALGFEMSHTELLELVSCEDCVDMNLEHCGIIYGELEGEPEIVELE